LKKGEVALIFVDERRIRELNRAFKKKDCPTDVLGFEVSPPGRTGTFGDIFISLDAAKSNAASFGSYFEKEIILYMIHGLLHLAGYDDVRPKDRMRMRSKETELLDEICKTRNLSRVST
jgi:probable rRNA maturation factor